MIAGSWIRATIASASSSRQGRSVKAPSRSARCGTPWACLVRVSTSLRYARMATTLEPRSGADLAEHGISASARVYVRPTTPQLYTHALRAGDAMLAEGGALVVDTGRHTGRAPNDKFIVREPRSEGRIWWGAVNADLPEEGFE